MKFFIQSILIISLISVAGCGARRNQVIVDPEGVNMAEYQQDLANCTQIAEQVDGKAGKGAVGGAIVGGLIGAAVGNKNTAKKIAGVGAVKGGVSGAAKTKREKQLVIKNCMRGRGYKVLN